MSQRRRFIVTAGGVVVAVAAPALVDAPTVTAQPRIHWRWAQRQRGHIAQGAYHQFLKE